MRHRGFIAVAGLALILLIGACGRKTAPLTPDSPRPETVKDVRVTVRDTVAYLSWSVPTRNIEGKDLSPSEIRGFLVYRAEIDREKKRPRYKQVAEIAMATPAPAVIRNGTVSWSDGGLRYGRVYGYRIRATTVRGGVSDNSGMVRAAPLTALAAPKNLAAAAGDSTVTLTWEPVETRSDGSRHQGFVGYNVYRGTEAGRHDERPVTREPLTVSSYRDESAQNGRTYFYIVRAVDSPVRPWQESLDSLEVSAAPHDLMPPNAPGGLTLVPGVGRVFLTWNENHERDLAGYHVYRAMKKGAEFVRLTAKPLNRTSYSDETVSQGMTYYYAITAVDVSGNESAPSKEKRTYTEKIR